MKKYKIGTCGHYDLINTIPNGQTIKTIDVTSQLINFYGINNVKIVSTHIWKRRPLKLFFQLFKLARTSENIIIFPDYNGVQVIVPILLFFQKIYKFSLSYVVIGAWLPELLNKKKKLMKKIKKVDYLFVETRTLANQLSDLGIFNTHIFPNFKDLEIVDEKKLNYSNAKPLKLCFFSRVTPKKGIEELINVIREINNEYQYTIYTLDIYGPIDLSFEQEFNKLLNTCLNEIKYCGVVEPLNSVNILKEYFLQVFPTRYKTEGFPGSILDSYFSGLPVLASRWNSWDDIIEEGKTGLSYEFDNFIDLKDKLIYIADNPDLINDMRINCINRAKLYKPEEVIKVITNFMK